MRFPLRLLLFPCLLASASAEFEEDLPDGPEAVEKVRKDYAKSEAGSISRRGLVDPHWAVK